MPGIPGLHLLTILFLLGKIYPSVTRVVRRCQQLCGSEDLVEVDVEYVVVHHRLRLLVPLGWRRRRGEARGNVLWSHGHALSATTGDWNMENLLTSASV